ncbi:MAG: class C sortase [Hornefia sp.]|nr:class C sortase [Hornefia sp.]
MKEKKIKDIAIKIIIAATFISGMGILLFPVSSNLNNELINYDLQKNYKSKIENNSTVQNQRLWLQARDYNRQHKVNVIADVFNRKHGEADTYSHKYNEVLNIGKNGMMGYIEIPKINLNLSVFHGVSPKVLERGAGHLEGTSLPVGGKGTHSAVAGHRGLPSARLFTDLDQMKKGDRFYLHVVDRTLAYEIDKIIVIKPEELTDCLGIVKNKDMVTLVTCTPYGVNSHRMLLRGCRVPVDDHQNKSPFSKYMIYGAVIAALTVVWVIFYVKRKNKNN